jgi:endonuclease YncB( thermonuclease family)
MPDVSLGFTPVTRRPYDAPLLRGVDGDTVNIDQAVRMASIDTPSRRLAGRRRPRSSPWTGAASG